MQANFYQVIQNEAERTAREVSAKTIIRIFYETYCMGLEQRLTGYVMLRSYRVTPLAGTGSYSVDAEIQCKGTTIVIEGSGPNPQAALLSALGIHLNIPLALSESSEHNRDVTQEQKHSIASYIKISSPLTSQESWGIGTGCQSVEAGMNAVISAVNGIMKGSDIPSNRTLDYSRQNRPQQQRAVAM
jgi:hypothetical protein